MVTAGNKFRRLSSVNYSTNTIHDHHHHHILDSQVSLSSKKIGKVRTIYPKNHENFKSSKFRVQFYRV